jgi:N-acetylmuramoyl-L-alanine amidase
MNVIPKTYRWAHPLGHRTGPPPGIVWHHAAGTGSPDQIHATHVAIGDSGIAYHYYVRKDGRIYRGRPEWAMGAHCLGHNDWLGVCAEGAYHVTKTMPPKQLAALQWLHDDIKRRRGPLPDKKHKDMSGNSTACPGQYFPMAKIVAGYDPLVEVKVRKSLWAAFKDWRKKHS